MDVKYVVGDLYLALVAIQQENAALKKALVDIEAVKEDE